MPADAPPTAEGDLGRTPFAHLLVYAVDRRLTGALFLNEPNGTEHTIRIARGAPVKIKPGDSYMLLGDLLVEHGAITERVLQDALATKGLLGDVLLLAGCVARDTLEEIAEEQFVRRIVRLFALPPETTFRYFDGDYALLDYGGDPASVDPLHLVWAGVSTHGERSTMFDGTLAVLGDAPIKVDPRFDAKRFGFGQDELRLVEHLMVMPSTFRGLAELELVTEDTLKRLLYALLITRAVDLGRGTTPCGSEDALRAAGQRTATLAKLAVRSVVHRQGAAAPDLPGDGERGPPSTMQRRDSSPASPRGSVAPVSALADEASTVTEALGIGIPAEPASSIRPTDRTPTGPTPTGLTPIEIEPVTLPRVSEAVPTPIMMPSIVAAKIDTGRQFAILEGVTVESLADAVAAENAESMSPSPIASPVTAPLADSPTPIAGGSPRDLFDAATNRFFDRDLLGALDACERACAAEPREPDYAALAVWIRAALPGADVKTLLVELDELLGVFEEHARARFYRGMLRRRLSDDAGALRDFRRVVEIDPSFEAATREVRLLEERNQVKEPKAGLLSRLFRR